MTIRKHYVDGPFGQIHLRLTPPVAGTTPLVCLHATAYSSQSFLPLMRELAGRRQVIAIDAPGYGESDRPPGPIAMADYAAATAAAIRAIGQEPVALFGYHTGVYVATELAIAAPALVERLVLAGIPYFQALDLPAWRARLAASHVLGGDLAQFSERWTYFVTHRAAGVTLERGFANFVDELKAWPDGSWAHEAMFAYDSDARLPLVRRPVLVLNPAGHLAEASRIAARLMPDCRVIEMPDVTGPLLETAAAQAAAAVEAFAAPHDAVRPPALAE